MKIKQPKVVIVDYGVGNLQSVSKALFKVGADKVEITEDPKKISEAEAIILPGVGSFEAGMRGLKSRGLEDTLKKAADKNIPILGICLGAQLLLSKGYEFGVHDGLEIIQGEVASFPVLPEKEKIPHIGWNKISPPRSVSWENTILEGMEDKEVYFVHSYILQPRKEEDCLAATIYGGHKFCSVVKKGNIYGCQFHPEKSGQIGLSIIKNFVRMVNKE